MHHTLLSRSVAPAHLALVLAVALVATSAGLVAMPGRALGWSAGTFSSTSEQQLFALTNQARASAGLRTLGWDSTLAGIARWRSQDMISRDYFSHNIPPGGGMVFDVLSQKGYCFNLAGENIGWNSGFGDDASATAAIQQMFMDSSGHRANILGKAWDVAGIGAYAGADGKSMWTVIFADKCGSTPTPTPKPTVAPTPKPTLAPTPRPTLAPTPKPTLAPTPKPTLAPTPRPTPRAAATPAPTPEPTPAPTPTAEPTPAPTPAPEATPTPEPTPAPTPAPEATPTPEPTPEATATPTPTPIPDVNAPATPDGSIDGQVLPDGVSLRVQDSVPSQGLVGGLLGSLLALLFGS